MANVEQLRAAVAQVSPDLQAKWRHAFSTFDADGSQTINTSELTAIMTSLGLVTKPGEVEAMIAAVDTNHDQVIDFEEFSMMMVASGRGGGQSLGFSHVVERFIKMAEIAKLITTECNGFVEVFCRTHRETFADLPACDPMQVEQNHAWMDTFSLFVEQAELTMQNLLMLWGVASQKSFEEEFIEAVGDRGDLLEGFLQLTDYPAFIRHMQQMQQQGLADEHPGVCQTPRPEAQMSQTNAQKRLAELDQRLASLDHERNAILAERRRLVGCEVQPVTTAALKQVLEMKRWKDDVGND